MAAGDFTTFEEFIGVLGNKLVDLDTDTIKVAVLKSTVTPTAADATPAYGATSGIDYDGNEVAFGGTYTTGGASITCTFTEAAGSAPFVASVTTNASWVANGSNSTDARWMLVYSDTATNKNAIGFLDLGANVNMQTTDLSLNTGTFTTIAKA